MHYRGYEHAHSFLSENPEDNLVHRLFAFSVTVTKARIENWIQVILFPVYMSLCQFSSSSIQVFKVRRKNNRKCSNHCSTHSPSLFVSSHPMKLVKYGLTIADNATNN